MEHPAPIGRGVPGAGGGFLDGTPTIRRLCGRSPWQAACLSTRGETRCDRRAHGEQGGISRNRGRTRPPRGAARQGGKIMFRRFVVPVLFALVAIPALADEGRIPIPFSSPGTPPIVIVQPGKYILTRNLKATAAGSCIQLAVPVLTPGDVDIDLNGFILDQSTNP